MASDYLKRCLIALGINPAPMNHEKVLELSQAVAYVVAEKGWTYRAAMRQARELL